MASSQTPNTASGDATTQILQSDDEIEALTGFQIKDAYARGKLMQLIVDTNDTAGYTTSEECQQIQEKLANGEARWLSAAAERALGRSHNITQILFAADSDSEMVEALFNRFTPEGPDVRVVARARESLKSAVASSGMPETKVMQARVSAHHETLSEMRGGL